MLCPSWSKKYELIKPFDSNQNLIQSPITECSGVHPLFGNNALRTLTYYSKVHIWSEVWNGWWKQQYQWNNVTCLVMCGPAWNRGSRGSDSSSRFMSLHYIYSGCRTQWDTFCDLAAESKFSGVTLMCELIKVTPEQQTTLPPAVIIAMTTTSATFIGARIAVIDLQLHSIFAFSSNLSINKKLCAT